MSLSTWFEGDPESCWRTAEHLDRLAVAVEGARGFVETQATVSPDDFDGWSADAYRLNAGRLHGRALVCGSACRALAVALASFGTTLDAVRLALRRTRALARQHLVVEGHEIRRPGPYADDLQRRIFRLVEHAVHEARRLEHQAHHDWQSALAEHAGTAPPPPTGAVAGSVPGAVSGGVPGSVPAPPPLDPPVPTPTSTPIPTQPALLGSSAPPAITSGTAAVLTSTARARGPRDTSPGLAVDRAPDLTLVPPSFDDWAPAHPVAISWEVPDGPR